MSETTVNSVIQNNIKTKAQWTSSNPVLRHGEIGLESDTLKLKAGTGSTNWNSLPYYNTDASTLSGKTYTDFYSKVNNYSMYSANANYTDTNSDNIGIKIRLPFSTSSSKMLTFNVNMYGSYSSTIINFSGYLYSSVNQWYLPKAILICDSTNTGLPVKMGRDTDGIAYVWVGPTQYTGISVTNITSGYSYNGDLSTGWEITRTNDCPNTALDSTIYVTSNRVSNKLNFTGAVIDSYDGSSTKTINIPPKVTVDNILTSTSTTNALSSYQGKVLNDKFNNYLPLSGGKMTGNININNLSIMGKNSESISFFDGEISINNPSYENTIIINNTGVTINSGQYGLSVNKPEVSVSNKFKVKNSATISSNLYLGSSEDIGLYGSSFTSSGTKYQELDITLGNTGIIFYENFTNNNFRPTLIGTIGQRELAYTKDVDTLESKSLIKRSVSYDMNSNSQVGYYELSGDYSNLPPIMSGYCEGTLLVFKAGSMNVQLLLSAPYGMFIRWSNGNWMTVSLS